MNVKHIIGIVVIAIFIAWGSFSFMETTVQYVSLEKASTSDRVVQVMGQIDFDVVSYNEESQGLEFRVQAWKQRGLGSNAALEAKRPWKRSGNLPHGRRFATGRLLRRSSSQRRVG